MATRQSDASRARWPPRIFGMPLDPRGGFATASMASPYGGTLDIHPGHSSSWIIHPLTLELLGHIDDRASFMASHPTFLSDNFQYFQRRYTQGPFGPFPFYGIPRPPRLAPARPRHIEFIIPSMHDVIPFLYACVDFLDCIRLRFNLDPEYDRCVVERDIARLHVTRICELIHESGATLDDWRSQTRMFAIDNLLKAATILVERCRVEVGQNPNLAGPHDRRGALDPRFARLHDAVNGVIEERRPDSAPMVNIQVRLKVPHKSVFRDILRNLVDAFAALETRLPVSEVSKRRVAIRHTIVFRDQVWDDEYLKDIVRQAAEIDPYFQWGLGDAF